MPHRKNCSETCPVIMQDISFEVTGQVSQRNATFCDRAPCSLELELLNLIIQHHPTAHQVVCKRGQCFYQVQSNLKPLGARGPIPGFKSQVYMKLAGMTPRYGLSFNSCSIPLCPKPILKVSKQLKRYEKVM